MYWLTIEKETPSGWQPVRPIFGGNDVTVVSERMNTLAGADLHASVDQTHAASVLRLRVYDDWPELVIEEANETVPNVGFVPFTANKKTEGFVPLVLPRRERTPR